MRRSRDDDGDDQVEEQDVGGGSSDSGHVSSPKRQRTETAGTSPSEHTDNEDNDDEEADGDVPLNADDMFTDDEDDDNDIDEESDTDDKKEYVRAQTSDSGVIIHIEFKNFMCHRHLKISLGRNINFINGSNGSGKSAILAGLQVCLGASARSTHRASSLNKLVRTTWGGDGEVSVKLLNCVDGYQYNVYGDSITVRRTIKKGGGSELALLSDDDAIVSKDRKELEKILEHLNIQVDNPCVVLDQENSKKFLQGSEADKFNFFLKATDLERVKATLTETTENIAIWGASIEATKKQLPRLEDNATHLKAEVAKYTALDDMENKLRGLQAQYMWSQYEAAQGACDAAKQDLTAHRNKITKLEGKIATGELKCAELERIKEERQREGEELLNRVEEKKVALSNMNLELTTAKKPLIAHKADEKSLMQEIKGLQTAKTGTERDIDAHRQRQLRDAEGEKERRLIQDLERTDTDLTATDDKIDRLKAQLEQLHNDVDVAKQAGADADAAFKTAHATVRSDTEHLNAIQKQSGNALAPFGRDIMELKRVIDSNARHFRHPPIGPLGFYVKMKQEYNQYQPCVEEHLKKNLCNYVVGCPEDKNLLQRMMNDVYRHSNKPSIVMSRPAAEAHRVPVFTDALQMSSVINVSSHEVFNALVDHNKIEGVLLAANKDEAERFVEGNGLRNGAASVMYPQASDQPSSRNSGGGGSSSNGNNNNNNSRGSNRVLVARITVRSGNRADYLNLGLDSRRPILCVDTAEAVRLAKEALADSQRHLDELKPSHEQKQREYRDLKQQEAQTGRQLSEAEQFKQRLTLQKEKLIRQQKDISNNRKANIDISDMEAVLAEHRDLIEERTEQLNTVRAAMRVLEAELAPLVKELLQIEQEKKDMSARVDEHQAEYDERLRALDTARGQVTKYKGAVKLLQKECAEKEGAVVATEAAVADMLTKCEDYMQRAHAKAGSVWDGKPVAAGTSPDKLKTKMEAVAYTLEDQRREQNLHRASKQEVTAQLVEAVELRNAAIKGLLQADSNISEAKLSSRMRKEKWKLLQRFIERQTSKLFDEHLQRKGSSGRLTFDRRNRTLGLTVQQNNKDESTQSSDAKSMSGGERSYATLALLLALGASHESPFRVLDEFDVFQDSVTRQTSLKELCVFARKNADKQFIFITPHSLNGVTPAADLKIHKMAPPRVVQDDKQTTLHETMNLKKTKKSKKSKK